MSDVDAFGREREEDPLAAMGWSAGAATAPPGPADGRADRQAATVVPVPPEAGREATGMMAVPAEARPSQEPPPPGARAIARAVATLVVIAGFGVALFALLVPWMSDLANGIKDGRSSQADGATPADNGPGDSVDVPAAPGRQPRGLDRESLLRHANLAPALAKLRARIGGRPRFVRVAADRVDVQVLLPGDRIRLGSVTFDGTARVLATTKAPGISSTASFAWSRVDPSAPRRLARSATGRDRRPLRAFSYAVLTDAAGLRWAAFLLGGRGFVAAPDGSGVRAIGG